MSHIAQNACIDAGQYASGESVTPAFQGSECEACFSNSAVATEISKWGGARPNSGGARPGAGRPRKDQRVIQSKPLGMRWYVIQIAPGMQKRVVQELLMGETRPGWIARPSFAIEIPTTAVERLVRGCVELYQAPMFQGYGLVEFDRAVDPWPLIREIDGVVQVLTTRSGTPLPLPPGFVEALIDTREDRLTIAAIPEEARSPGDYLRVADGPMTSFPAVVIECDGFTTTADVQIFGRSTTVTLPYASFEAA